ncbi:MAG: hypothetical protein ACI8UR_000825 [Natronomonas sp.]|jgi:hypothetical protein
MAVRPILIKGLGSRPESATSGDFGWVSLVPAWNEAGYCPERLVETFRRRIAESALSGTLYHHLRLDASRLHARTDPE